jgi:hypothetical protein
MAQSQRAGSIDDRLPYLRGLTAIGSGLNTAGGALVLGQLDQRYAAQFPRLLPLILIVAGFLIFLGAQIYYKRTYGVIIPPTRSRAEKTALAVIIFFCLAAAYLDLQQVARISFLGLAGAGASLSIRLSPRTSFRRYFAGVALIEAIISILPLFGLFDGVPPLALGSAAIAVSSIIGGILDHLQFVRLIKAVKG